MSKQKRKKMGIGEFTTEFNFDEIRDLFVLYQLASKDHIFMCILIAYLLYNLLMKKL